MLFDTSLVQLPLIEADCIVKRRIMLPLDGLVLPRVKDI